MSPSLLSAPSSSDIYHLTLIFNDLTAFGATPQEVANYIVSFNPNVVSGDYIYTITIKNAFQFGLMKDSFNNNVERKRYENLTKKYLTDNFLGEPTAEQIQAAGESALLQLYGDQVHITKRKINDPKSIKVLKRQNKKVTSTNGC